MLDSHNCNESVIIQGKVWIQQSASMEVKKDLKQCIKLCYVSLSCSWVSTGQTGKYSHKERGHTVFALLSSAQWLMKDQKPQRGEALDSCILFPLNINTLVRQMGLQPHLYAALLQRLQSTEVQATAFKTNYHKNPKTADWGCGDR